MKAGNIALFLVLGAALLLSALGNAVEDKGVLSDFLKAFVCSVKGKTVPFARSKCMSGFGCYR